MKQTTILMFVLFGLLIGCDVQQPSPSSGQESSISVTGGTTHYVKPDLAYIHFSIRSTSAEEAQSVIDHILVTTETSSENKGNPIFLQSKKIDPYGDIQRDQNGNEQSRAFERKIHVVIETKTMPVLPTVVKAGVEAGAIPVRIEFGLTDQNRTRVKKQAVQSATGDARSQAEAIASELGKQIRRVETVSSVTFRVERNVYKNPFKQSIVHGRATLVEINEPEWVEKILLPPPELKVKAQLKVTFHLGE